MAALLRKQPVYKEVMDMDFRFYHMWASPYAKPGWQDGLNPTELKIIYKDFYELTTYLLTEYKGSGKRFFLGHWEGDWLLIGKTDASIDPTPQRILGFAQYLNVRQQAIEDARVELQGQGVWVYHYTEVNQVWKGIDGSRPTLTNSVLPLVNVDFVSYSSYDVIQRKTMREDLHRALDHIESQLKPRPELPGKRVFVGEYAIKAASVKYDPLEHEARNREVTHAILEWGCPFAIYWPPAMNTMMWENPATQRNLSTLINDGIQVIGPDRGETACGETGLGRLVEPELIFERIQNFFTNGSLHDIKALVTSGPTFEPIDPVRFIGNRSSGKQGHALAEALRDLGADVTLVTGPVALKDPKGINVIHVETAQEMHTSCMKSLPADIAVCVAAVADWGVDTPSHAKIKKTPESKALSDIQFSENPDILKT
ncbi:MAG: phosphopantothenoylcysteine decarboxylase, partial [Verrucomicrobiota bacterium]